MLEKTDQAGIVKDKQSGALLNNDINKLKAYKKQKMILAESKKAVDEMTSIKQDLDFIKSEITAIKNMLKEKQ